jgi:DNA (cytosine-5)-methyltransferase 1
VGKGADIVVAIDHNEFADLAYRHNFSHPTQRWNVVGIKAHQLEALDAEMWWMSPPCQPFTVRGQRRDIADPRCEALLHLMDLIASVRPTHIGFENVPAFQGSRAHAMLREVLDKAGYQWQERLLCHSQLGVPNKRRRFYLVASLETLAEPAPVLRRDRHLSTYLSASPDPSLTLEQDLLERFGDALPITHLDDPWPDTFCYTSAYGKSPVFAGSYVKDMTGIRRLSPREILRLHHFPDTYELPPSLTLRRAYHLVGNSLSVLAVREVLRPLGLSHL